MPDPRDLQLSSYDYPLPPEHIAQAPVEPRHSARLLMVPPQREPSMDAAHGQVWDLLEQLQPGDLLVVNDTRVLKARLAVRRSCLLYTSPSPRDYAASRMPSSA